MMEPIALDVASDMKVNSVWPKMRYNGKFSILKRKIVEKTTVKTTIISNGFKTDHRMPRTLRRYFSLKSLETKERRMNQSRLNCSLAELIEYVRLLGVGYST